MGIHAREKIDENHFFHLCKVKLQGLWSKKNMKFNNCNLKAYACLNNFKCLVNCWIKSYKRFMYLITDILETTNLLIWKFVRKYSRKDFLVLTFQRKKFL